MALKPKLKQSGFSLIELMIVVAIVAILASVAYPSYQSQIRQSRRSDAVQALAAVQQAEERIRANNASYTATLATLGLSSPTKGGYYSFAITNATSTGYAVTFTGLGSQASDTGCATLLATVAAGNTTYAQPTCWSK